MRPGLSLEAAAHRAAWAEFILARRAKDALDLRHEEAAQRGHADGLGLVSQSTALRQRQRAERRLDAAILEVCE